MGGIGDPHTMQVYGWMPQVARTGTRARIERGHAPEPSEERDFPERRSAPSVDVTQQGLVLQPDPPAFQGDGTGLLQVLQQPADDFSGAA